MLASYLCFLFPKYVLVREKRDGLKDKHTETGMNTQKTQVYIKTGGGGGGVVRNTERGRETDRQNRRDMQVKGRQQYVNGQRL